MQLLETRNAFRLPCSMRGKGTQAGQSSNSSLWKPKGLTKDTVPMSQALSSSYSNRWLWAVTDPSVSSEEQTAFQFNRLAGYY